MAPQVTTVGQSLIAQALPGDHGPSGVLTKSRMNQVLIDLARKDPFRYPRTVRALKAAGDEVSTLEGISVGLDDIDPNPKARDEALAPHIAAFGRATSDEQRRSVVMGAQNTMLDYAKKHPGTLAEMVRSGGRGNYAQLMKIVASPAAARNFRGDVVPFLIKKSYAEGLTPAEMWVAGDEARVNAIASNISVVEPGDLAKILINNLNDKVVTVPDCHTTNGIALRHDDINVGERYLAADAGPFKAGSFMNSAALQVLRAGPPRDVLVRSPMTCELGAGVCQRCMGHAPDGQLYQTGTNVGIRAAQAMAEPLTQMALSAKHGGQLAKDMPEARLEGIRGVRQLLEVPKSFAFRAALAEHDGTVTRIEDAPQGGVNIYVDKTRHYVAPPLKATVTPGDKVEAGDVLSNGVPKPDEVVQHKGLGAGRDYLVGQMQKLYQSHGVDIDRRHFELLSKALLNWVRVDDPGSAPLLRGDVVSYNTYLGAARKAARPIPLTDALGETLSDNVLHYTAGTRIDAKTHADLLAHGVTDVSVGASGAPIVTPIVRPATRAPLLNPDWMARIAHRYLREGLLSGAHTGATTDMAGTNPVPAYAAGKTFGQGGEGRY